MRPRPPRWPLEVKAAPELQRDRQFLGWTRAALIFLAHEVTVICALTLTEARLPRTVMPEEMELILCGCVPRTQRLNGRTPRHSSPWTARSSAPMLRTL